MLRPFIDPEDTNMLIPEDDDPSGEDIVKKSQAYLMATSFKEWLRSARHLGEHVKVSLTGWTLKFQDLIDLHKADTVQAVLTWYMTNYVKQKGKLPSAFSGGKFHLHFKTIKEAMEDKSNLTVSDWSKELAAMLRSKHFWRNGIDTYLEVVVQRSFDNYAAFHRKVVDYVEANPDDAFFRWCMRTGKLTGPKGFVVEWMLSLQEEFRNWKEWNGKYKSLVWTLDSPSFLKRCSEWAYKWNGKPSSWQNHVSKLSQEKSS